MSRYGKSYFPEREIVKSIKNWGLKTFDIVIWSDDEYNEMSVSMEFINRNLENSEIISIINNVCIFKYNEITFKITKTFDCFSSFKITIINNYQTTPQDNHNQDKLNNT